MRNVFIFHNNFNQNFSESIMDELKQLLHDYMTSVPGVLGIILSDKEGIPIIRYAKPS